MLLTTIYNERSAIEPLSEGKTVLVRGIGNSMTPLLKSGQVVTVEPVSLEDVRKGDIVLSKVRNNVYLHKVTGVKPGLVQISNNHGHINGWTNKVYGRVTDELQKEEGPKK